MRTFHSALDDLENEIVSTSPFSTRQYTRDLSLTVFQVRAKSVMQRDMARLQANKTLSAPPQPVEAQSKSPMVIDLDSSPPKANGAGFAADHGTESKTVAPFPDMGMDISIPILSDDGPAATTPAPQATNQSDVKPETPSSAPMTAAPPSADKAGSGSKPNDAAPGEANAEAHNAEVAFTDMEFTLAPAENGGQVDQGTQDQSFDLPDFGPPSDANNPVTLDNLLPLASTEQHNDDPLAAPDMATRDQGQADSGANTLNEPAFDALNMDNMDFGAADGTDFDFSMDDGNSFNDLMSSHEQNFDTSMEHGQFDADFFGLDKPDGT